MLACETQAHRKVTTKKASKITVEKAYERAGLGDSKKLNCITLGRGSVIRITSRLSFTPHVPAARLN